MPINPFDDTEAIARYAEEALFENVAVTHTHAHKKQMRCPICGDGSKANSKRGWFDTLTGSYKCYNGDCEAERGMSGLWFSAKLRNRSYGEECANFIAWYTKSQPTHSEASPLTLEAMNRINATEEVQTQPKSRETIELDDNWVDLPDKVRNYCEYRQLFSAPFAPKNWKLYFDVRTKRLVIPWMNNGKIVYWQKRSLMSNDDPKYLYPSSESRPVFNLDNVDEDWPYIVLTEAALDAIFIRNCVAFGGISPSAGQLEEIANRYPHHQPVLLLDNFRRDITARKKLDYNWETKEAGYVERHRNWLFFAWPKAYKSKDVNEAVINGERKDWSDKNWLEPLFVTSFQMRLLMNYKYC